MQGTNLSNVNVTRGIPPSADAKRTRSINILQGIRPLDLSQSAFDGEASGNCTTINRNGGIKQDEENRDMSPKSWSKVVASPITKGPDLTPQVQDNLNVKITMEDIKEEIEFWNSAIVCFVLGSNPPQSVMEGYSQRIWGSLGINKIAQINRGVFMVRFHSFKRKTKVIEDGVQMFDRKPVVVKP